MSKQKSLNHRWDQKLQIQINSSIIHCAKNPNRALATTLPFLRYKYDLSSDYDNYALRSLRDLFSQYNKLKKQKVDGDNFISLIPQLEVMLTDILQNERFKDTIKSRDQIHRTLVEEIGTANAEYVNILAELAELVTEKVTLLLLGETGVGKSFLVNLVHKLSGRSEAKLYSINCANLKEELLESELFGHKKGAFTDAKLDKKGKIELAKDGTLFLDEIDRAPKATRDKILLLIEAGEYSELGSTDIMKPQNVRFIVATNKDLRSLVERGEFEEDFYRRVIDFSFEIPPLRKRKSDVQLLMKRLLDDLYKEYNYKVGIDEDAFGIIATYDWPGNVRELKNRTLKYYLKCKYNSKNIIDYELVSKYPPVPLRIGVKARFKLLENILSEFFKNWDYNSRGNFLDAFVKPIIAQLRKDHPQKINAKMCKQILGLEDNRRESEYKISLDRYQEIADTL